MIKTIAIHSTLAFSTLAITAIAASKEDKNHLSSEPASIPDGGKSGSDTPPIKTPPASPTSAPAPKSTLLASGLAFGKKVSASSFHEDKYKPENAIDGDPFSYWSSEFKDGAWLAVDLGERKNVSRVVVFWEQAYASAFSVEVSKDGKTWTGVYETKEGKGGISEIKFAATESNYVRLNCAKRATSWGNAVSEIQVFE